MYSVKEHDLRLQLLYKLKTKNQSLKKSIERSKISRQILENQLNTCMDLAKRKIEASEKMQKDLDIEEKYQFELEKINKELNKYQNIYEEQKIISELLQKPRKETRLAKLKSPYQNKSNVNTISHMKLNIEDTKEQIKQLYEMFSSIESEHSAAVEEYNELLKENSSLAEEAKKASQIPSAVAEIENVKIPELIAQCKGLDELIAENSRLKSKLQRVEKNISTPVTQNQDSSSPSSHEAESLRREIFELREKLDLIDAGFGEIQTQAARVRARCLEVMRCREDMDMRGAVFRF